MPLVVIDQDRPLHGLKLLRKGINHLSRHITQVEYYNTLLLMFFSMSVPDFRAATN